MDELTQAFENLNHVIDQDHANIKRSKRIKFRNELLASAAIGAVVGLIALAVTQTLSDD